jgi:hypothetical protein
MKKHFEEHLNNPDLYHDPKHPKSRCVIHASGKHFDPNAFLSESSFSQQKNLITGILGLPDEIRQKLKRKELPENAKEKIERGELTGEEFFTGFEIFETPFLFIPIIEQTYIKSQFEEAVLFLKKHLEDLIKLQTHYNVENISISFLAEDYDSSKYEQLPREFFDLCSRIGMSASFGQSKAVINGY